MTATLPPPPLPLPPPALLDGAGLFLDFDGTLVEIVDRPDAVVIEPALCALLDRLSKALPGRLAIVSGRSIAQLDGFLGPGLAGIALAGSHGCELRLADGTLLQPCPPAGLDAATRALARFAGSRPGTIVEPKSYGVTLHYRLAPDQARPAQSIARQMADEHGLELQPGKMMMELKIAGCDKGDAVAALMRTGGMDGTCPWFIGDDLTDEAGFAAARRLGGGGILVGRRPPTEAIFSLPDVAAVRAWLATALGGAA